MEIQQINEEAKGFFHCIENDREIGKMTYSWAGDDKIIIDHTEVDPAFKGRDIGKKMVMEAVNFARKNRIKIIPLCPFVKSVFSKNANISDVLT